VLVVVVAVFGVAVAVMKIVHVVPVRHGFMGAVVAAVAVVLGGVFGGIVVFVVVVLMGCVAVAVVKIVHVVTVLDCFMGAVAAAVRVLGEGVFCLDLWEGSQSLWLP
jgi:hypothetical protein